MWKINDESCGFCHLCRFRYFYLCLGCIFKKLFSVFDTSTCMPISRCQTNARKKFLSVVCPWYLQLQIYLVPLVEKLVRGASDLTTWNHDYKCLTKRGNERQTARQFIPEGCADHSKPMLGCRSSGRWNNQVAQSEEIVTRDGRINLLLARFLKQLLLDGIVADCWCRSSAPGFWICVRQIEE